MPKTAGYRLVDCGLTVSTCEFDSSHCHAESNSVKYKVRETEQNLTFNMIKGTELRSY